VCFQHLTTNFLQKALQLCIQRTLLKSLRLSAKCIVGTVWCKFIRVYSTLYTLECNQQDATFYNNLLYLSMLCSTCFRRFFRPSSGAHKTVNTASGIVELFCCLPLAEACTVCTVHVVPNNTLGKPAYHINRTLYHMFLKNLSLALLKMGKNLPETCWADLEDQ
jgi:hypothetical protein